MQSYERFKRDYLESCRALHDFLDTPTMQEFQSSAEVLARILRGSGAPRAVLELVLADYAEDLVSQLVGEEQVYSFFKSCLFRLE
jgi:hypothetical protein